MITLIDSVERIDRSASLRTSAATTANPCLPRRPGASIAAFSASRFVWPEMSLISSRISPIFCLLAERQCALGDRLDLLLHVMHGVSGPLGGHRDRAHGVRDGSGRGRELSIVVDVCATAADCSLVTAAGCAAAPRNLTQHRRRRAKLTEELVELGQGCLQILLPRECRRSSRSANTANARQADTARTAATTPIHSAWVADELAAAARWPPLDLQAVSCWREPSHRPRRPRAAPTPRAHEPGLFPRPAGSARRPRTGPRSHPPTAPQPGLGR